MSAKLASNLGFSKTAATDTIREVLRMNLSEEEVPPLHRSSFEDAGNSAKEDWLEMLKQSQKASVQWSIGLKERY